MKRAPFTHPRIKTAGAARPARAAKSGKGSFPVIAMAASVGGLKALSVIVGGLPADFPACHTALFSPTQRWDGSTPTPSA